MSTSTSTSCQKSGSYASLGHYSAQSELRETIGRRSTNGYGNPSRKQAYGVGHTKLGFVIQSRASSFSLHTYYHSCFGKDLCYNVDWPAASVDLYSQGAACSSVASS